MVSRYTGERDSGLCPRVTVSVLYAHRMTDEQVSEITDLLFKACALLMEHSGYSERQNERHEALVAEQGPLKVTIERA